MFRYLIENEEMSRIEENFRLSILSMTTEPLLDKVALIMTGIYDLALI